MDFETEDGINALQMDIKIKGLFAHYDEGADAARDGLYILSEMRKAISEPVRDVFVCPRIITFRSPR